MAQNSKIEWTDHTFNPWMGCTNVSPGCDHCYAEAWAARFGLVEWGNAPRKKKSAAGWREPVKWNAAGPAFEAEHGRRQRVFCASLADAFDNQVDPAWRTELFDLIRNTASLDWLLLTKRPQNIAKMLPADWGSGYPNVWLGATTENQTEYDRRWPLLAAIPAVVRFVSYEPALGPVILPATGTSPDWVICGGESPQPKCEARIMQPEWAREMRDRCEVFGIAFFFKQWGNLRSNPLVSEQGMSISEARKVVDHHGTAGGIIDGRLHRAWPTPREIVRQAA